MCCVEVWIGTMVTIMSVCAVFVTVTPLLNNKRINDLENRIKELEKDTRGLRATRERNEILLKKAMNNNKADKK